MSGDEKERREEEERMPPLAKLIKSVGNMTKRVELENWSRGGGDRQPGSLPMYARKSTVAEYVMVTLTPLS